MKLADAENEFWLREYVWAKSEWENEINSSFPHLRMFKTGHHWDVYQFMRKLGKDDQLALAWGRLKQRNQEVASKWGESLSEKERLICRKFDAFSSVKDSFRIFKQLHSEGKISDAKIIFDIMGAPAARTLFDTDSMDIEFLSFKLTEFFDSIPQSLEQQIKTRKETGEKIKLVGKKKLQKILTQKIKDVFAGQLLECNIDEGHWTAFDIQCCGGWMINTQFSFGRQQGLLRYWHTIGSEKKIQHRVISTVMHPAKILSRAVWPCAWEWECILEEDIGLACDESFKYCRRFFEAAPRLLKGLDVENITEN